MTTARHDRLVRLRRLTADAKDVARGLELNEMESQLFILTLAADKHILWEDLSHHGESPDLIAVLARHVPGYCYTTPEATLRGEHPAPACLCDEKIDQVLTAGSELGSEAFGLGYNWRY